VRKKETQTRKKKIKRTEDKEESIGAGIAGIYKRHHFGWSYLP